LHFRFSFEPRFSEVDKSLFLAPSLRTTSCNVHYSGSILYDNERETWSKSRPLVTTCLARVWLLTPILRSATSLFSAKNHVLAICVQNPWVRPICLKSWPRRDFRVSEIQRFSVEFGVLEISLLKTVVYDMF
jgi:hypothetical protein